MLRPLLAVLILPTLFISTVFGATPIRVLIIDGQNDHDWRQTTPILQKILDESGLFQTAVVTAPPKGGDFRAFRPEFNKFQVVVSNYNDLDGGNQWPAEVQQAFEEYVHGGGGFVCYHAADNAFPNWQAYNLMIGIGGWMNRNEGAGPHWYFTDGQLVSDRSPGPAGSHGDRKPFAVVIQDPEHPITRGLPPLWVHASDELYARLRGPGVNMDVLATAYSDPANNGSGHDEPVLMALRYGKGRVFHTTLGHDAAAMECVGFITTFLRGCEWAATGRVTQKVPPDFPSVGQVSTRHLAAQFVFGTDGTVNLVP
jgi:type 1 glutamine amidotransferase